MSLEIKTLTIDPPSKDISLAAPIDTFNVIPTANEVYDLYAAPNDPVNNIRKSAIVKSIRMINTHASSAVKVSLYYNKPANGQYRRRLLAPAEISLPAGFSLLDDSEVTMDPGDKIQAKAD